MKKICVITATRAEYGLLSTLIAAIDADEELELQLVVSGTHLSRRHGYTKREILEDGFAIAGEIDILDKNKCSISEIMGKAMIRFSRYIQNDRPDMAVILGDRYEMLAFAAVLANEQIPIAHLNGGEITQGALDDVYRHCITKLSYLHFPACEIYRKRIIQLGEEPERVFNYGDIGIEHIRKMQYMTKEELELSLGISLDQPYASVTFHPVTLEKDTAFMQTKALIEALEEHTQMLFIISLANADEGGDQINAMLVEEAQTHENLFCFPSLGIKRYLSMLKYAQFVIGNSSSGIVEAPCFGIPTINIGDRQKGRLRADSVIDCAPERQSILQAINKAQTRKFQELAKKAVNPYGDGETSSNILRTMKKYLNEDRIDLKKKFYDKKDQSNETIGLTWK